MVVPIRLVSILRANPCRDDCSGRVALLRVWLTASRSTLTVVAVCRAVMDFDADEPAYLIGDVLVRYTEGVRCVSAFGCRSFSVCYWLGATRLRKLRSTPGGFHTMRRCPISSRALIRAPSSVATATCRRAGWARRASMCCCSIDRMPTHERL